MRGLKYFWNNFAVTFHKRLAPLPQWQVAAGCAAMTLLISYFDFLLGAQISLAVFYAVPIGLMSWFGGMVEGIAMTVLSVCLLAWGNYLMAPATPWTPIFNGALRFVFYVILVLGLVRLRDLQINLRTLAEEGAKALAQEAARNAGLERGMLEAAQREQRRIGQDLHDGLCQHLTGTALAGQVLVESLAANGAVQAQARKVVELVEGGIALARGIAKGLYPIELGSDGLMHALQDFTVNTSDLFGIDCRFECSLPVLVDNPSTAAHLYHIAQEAVSNAVRHGRATAIEVSLEESDSGVRLSVADNGKGLPSPLPVHDGMGLRTMADRARSMGGQFYIHAGALGGAEVICVAPGGWLT